MADNKKWINDNTARIEALAKRLEDASYTDVSDTTATSSDVASGKLFYDAQGKRSEGSLKLPTGEKGEYFVKVIDYDGTILKEEWLNTGDTFTLPNTPSHNGLVFQEWSCSTDIIDGVITIEDNDVMVGATYTTASGLTEFDITLTKVTGLDVTLNMDGTKNWGDGTSDQLTTHTYTEYGDYTITCDGTTMTTSSNAGVFGQSSSAKNYYCKNVRFTNNVVSIGNYAFQECSSLRNVIIPNSVTSIGQRAFYTCYLVNIVIPNSVTSIGDTCFGYCYSLANIVIPNSVTRIIENTFITCYSLTNIVIPNSVSGIEGDPFYNCYTLKSIAIPNGVGDIDNSCFFGCYSLANIVIPNSVTRIGTYAFRMCYSMIKYDFTKVNQVPTLASTNAFTGINSITKIYVPDELYDQWIVATNWATYVDYIYKASEMPIE